MVEGCVFLLKARRNTSDHGPSFSVQSGDIILLLKIGFHQTGSAFF